MSSSIEFSSELPCDSYSIRAIQSRIAEMLNDLGFLPSDKIEVRLALETAIEDAVGSDEAQKANHGLMLSCTANQETVKIEIEGAQNGSTNRNVEPSRRIDVSNGVNGESFMRALMSVVSYDSRTGRVVLEKRRGIRSSAT